MPSSLARRLLGALALVLITRSVSLSTVMPIRAPACHVLVRMKELHVSAAEHDALALQLFEFHRLPALCLKGETTAVAPGNWSDMTSAQSLAARSRSAGLKLGQAVRTLQ